MKNITKFYEVVLKCPYDDALSDCAFNHYRQMSITKLINVAQEMDAAEIDSLLLQHDHCLSKRKAKKLAS